MIRLLIVCYEYPPFSGGGGIALRDIARDHTSLVIAHRLSTVVDADIILVLQHGHIVEQGSHQALLETNGKYAELWRAQLRQRDSLTA